MPDQDGHVLVIEDELLVGLGLQAMLAELGFSSFAFASTARQALEQAMVQCPDLVTVDVGLLDGDGFQAVEAITAACGALPVIYVTGDGEAAKARTDRVVVEKPVSIAQLARAVAQARQAPQSPNLEGGSAERHGTVIVRG